MLKILLEIPKLEDLLDKRDIIVGLQYLKIISTHSSQSGEKEIQFETVHLVRFSL